MMKDEMGHIEVDVRSLGNPDRAIVSVTSHARGLTAELIFAFEEWDAIVASVREGRREFERRKRKRLKRAA